MSAERLPNACPTCLVPAYTQCVTKAGKPTVTHIPRARGQWPVLHQCLIGPRAGERVGSICGYCGHSSFVHPGPYTNPALSECVICAMNRAIREAQSLTPTS